MIKVGKLASQHSSYALPDSRARMLAHSSLDYFRACALANEHQWQDDGIPFTSFLLPAMHQTLELGTKAVALLVDPELNIKRYSHKTQLLMSDYASRIPVIESILSLPDVSILLTNLETAYIGMRYGECYSQTDGSAWRLFERIALLLFSDLSARTGLRFPTGHRIVSSNT